MNLPKSYSDLTVRQFQEASAILNSKIQDNFLGDLTIPVRLVACLAGKSEDDVLELCSKAELIKYYSGLSWINNIESLEKSPICKKIVAGKHIYCALLGFEDFKSGQNITLKLLEGRNDTAKYLNEMLATMYVPMNWYGSPKKYKASRHQEIAEALKDARLADVYGMLIYKKKLFEILKMATLNSFQESVSTIKEMMPEVTAWAETQGLKVS